MHSVESGLERLTKIMVSNVKLRNSLLTPNEESGFECLIEKWLWIPNRESESQCLIEKVLWMPNWESGFERLAEKVAQNA